MQASPRSTTGSSPTRPCTTARLRRLREWRPHTLLPPPLYPAGALLAPPPVPCWRHTFTLLAPPLYPAGALLVPPPVPWGHHGSPALACWLLAGRPPRRPRDPRSLVITLLAAQASPTTSVWSSPHPTPNVPWLSPLRPARRLQRGGGAHLRREVAPDEIGRALARRAGAGALAVVVVVVVVVSWGRGSGSGSSGSSSSSSSGSSGGSSSRAGAGALANGACSNPQPHPHPHPHSHPNPNLDPFHNPNP